jgi:predicted tellurium resistance membrane protein TerC
MLTLDGLASLLTLTLMEIVLGIDNIVFLSILTGSLERREQRRAQVVGLTLALAFRMGLLATITWIMRLTRPLFEILGHGVSGRDLILIVGGLFLIGKATHELYEKLEVPGEEPQARRSANAFALLIVQIIALDLVFSLDSVITAVGMAKDITIMVTAMIVAVGIMLVFAGAIGTFVNRHPSVKILGLSFLLLIGFMLALDGMGHHVPKGYIYVAMAFALGVELMNMRYRGKRRAVQLHSRFEKDAPG